MARALPTCPTLPACAALAAVLLLLPTVLAATATPVASVDAAALHAEAGVGRGPLDALEMKNAPAGRGFTLQASSAIVVLEQESGPTVVNQTPPPTADPPERHDLRDLTGLGGLRAGNQLYVLGLPGRGPPDLESSGGCAELAPSLRQVVEVPLYVEQTQARHRERASVEASVAWEAPECVQGWTLRGDFLLSLWEADIAVSHSEGQADFAAGRTVTPRGPGDLFSTHRDRQLFLQVRDGTLVLEAVAPTLYLREVRLEAGVVRIDGSSGTRAGAATPFVDVDLDLRGDLEADVRRAGPRLGVAVRGDLEGAAVDGASVALREPPSALSSPAWLGAFVLAPAVAVAYGVWHRPVRRLLRLEDLALAGHHAAVAGEAARLRRDSVLGPEALALRIQALAKAGRHEEALAAARGLPVMEAELAAAYVHALARDFAACSAALRVCAAIDGAWLQLALEDAVFLEARRHPALAWLGSGVP